MSEKDTVAGLRNPNTRESLAKEFETLGLIPGATVIVHASMSKLGWVCGGPQAVVLALMDVLTPTGTLVMPTHSAEYSEPSYWQNPPVPINWWATIRESMPAFDPATTPTRKMGVIAETFRKFPDVLRSYHPSSSFAAWGKHAAVVTEKHTLDFPMGEGSPLARVYELDGSVALLGVDHDSNTSLHLSEARSQKRKTQIQGGPIFWEGKRVWTTFKDYETDADEFLKLGVDFGKTGRVLQRKVGQAPSSYMRQQLLVDFGLNWIKEQTAVLDSAPRQ